MTTQGIKFLDLRKWFLQMKDTSKYPLFPKTGIHWSKYGEIIAADSIVRFIESEMKREMPKIVIDSIVLSDTTKYADDDIEQAMNLLINIKDLPMAYPKHHIEADHIDSMQKVLTIADSYYWEMFNWGMSKLVFNKGQFWYYFKKIYPASFDSLQTVNDVDIIAELQKNDVIIILITDANMFDFAFGFVDKVYDLLFNDKRALST